MEIVNERTSSSIHDHLTSAIAGVTQTFGKTKDVMWGHFFLFPFSLPTFFGCFLISPFLFLLYPEPTASCACCTVVGSRNCHAALSSFLLKAPV